MANHTPNYNLSTPEATDTQASFIADYVTNMGIIDSNLGSGGGGGFVEMTTASYEALPDEQKLDPNKLYMLNDTPPTDIPVDFDDCVNKKASRMSVSVVDGALVWTYSGVGGQVSANSFYPTAIPKEAEKLVISLSTGTAYNASTFEIGVGVRATYQDTSYVYSNDQSWLAIATYNQINQSNVELEVDLSNVTDDSYLVIACFGWNVTFDSIVVKFGGTPQVQTSMRYKDVPYADGQGGGSSVAWTQIQQSGTKIAEIEIDGVTTDVYAPQGAPPFSALIIITADTGKTVTATKGGDTYTATEVSSGQYEVTVDSIGTWTISDGTLSDTVTVTSSTTYYVTLSSIPDGSTVLPTDDIQIWLNCADIWDKAYTTLSEVLSDTVTLTALIADNNAVDYMVRSTTWAVPQALVPVMTDDTHPSGVASAGSTYTGLHPYYAFDGNVNTYWQGNTNFSYDYVQYDFGKQTPIKRADFTAQGNSAASYNYISILQGSNDGVTFTSLATEQSGSITDATYTKSISVDANYRYYRLNNYRQTQVNVSGRIKELQFYSPSITDDSNAMSYIGLNNYASNTLLADSTWCEAILNSDYFDSVINVRVPYMTSNTLPSGVASASSSVNNDNLPWMAFNEAPIAGVARLKWHSAMNPSLPQWLRYQFPEGKVIKWARVQNWQGNPAPGAKFIFKIQGSNDASTWVDLTDTITMDYNPNWLGVICELSNNTAYQYYQLYFTSYVSASAILIQCLQFYGRKDV